MMNLPQPILALTVATVAILGLSLTACSSSSTTNAVTIVSGIGVGGDLLEATYRGDTLRILGAEAS